MLVQKLTTGGTDVACKREERVVCYGRPCAPRICESSFDKDKRRSTEQAREESQGQDSVEVVCEANANHADRKKDDGYHVDRLAADTLRCVRYPYRRECYAEEHDTESHDRCGHVDVKLFLDICETSGIGRYAEGTKSWHGQLSVR